MTEPTRDDVVTVYEGKEGYALVDALEWRTMKGEIARLKTELESAVEREQHRVD